MAITYRESRNIKASIIKYLIASLLTDGLSAYSVINGFVRAYDTSLPVICVRNGTRTPVYTEIGSVKTTKNDLIYIDVFAKDEAGKADITDWLIDTLQPGCDYYEHETEEGGTLDIEKNGNVIVTNIAESGININTDKSQLLEHDQYRTLLTLTVTTGKVS